MFTFFFILTCLRSMNIIWNVLFRLLSFLEITIVLFVFLISMIFKQIDFGKDRWQTRVRMVFTRYTNRFEIQLNAMYVRAFQHELNFLLKTFDFCRFQQY